MLVLLTIYLAVAYLIIIIFKDRVKHKDEQWFPVLLGLAWPFIVLFLVGAIIYDKLK